MVRRREKLLSFAGDESGATLAESLVVMFVLLIVLFLFVEFGYAVHQWNRAAKAVQVGARLASVSDPLESSFLTDPKYDGIKDTGQVDNKNAAGSPYDPGDTDLDYSCPNRAAGQGGNTCPDYDEAAALWIIGGSTGEDGGKAATEDDLDCSGTGPVLGMCDVLPTIGLNNLVVQYQYSGLGYAGRPGGPVPTIIVSLVDMNLPCLVLCNLFGLGNIPMPVAPVTVSGEDLFTKP